MAVESLSSEAQTLIRRVLAFIVTTSQLEGEFEARLGVNRSELAELVMRWPAVDDRDDRAPATVAISNALNEVAHGLDLSVEEWHQLGATRREVELVQAAWASERHRQSTGLR